MTKQAHCTACVLYSETHSRWNLKRQAMPHSSANCRHSDKGYALRTFGKLYGSATWRQARWWQIISHSALPKPRVLAFKFFIWYALVGCFIYMSLSYFTSVYLLSINLGDLWARGRNVHCCGITIIWLLWHYDYLLWVYYLHMLFAHASNMEWWCYEWGGVTESYLDTGMCDTRA